MKPARKVVTRSPHRSVGYVAGAGLGGTHAEHESGLEKTFVVLASVCSGVEGLEPQPFRMPWTDPEGKTRTYVPDYRVTFTDGTQVIVEVKPRKFVERHEALFEQATRHLASSGHSFFVITDDHLTRERYEVAQLWRRYRRAELPAESVRHVNQLLMAGITWEQACASSVPLHVWYGLLGRRAIGFQAMEGASHSDTRLFNVQELEEHDCQIRFCRWFGCTPWEPTFRV